MCVSPTPRGVLCAGLPVRMAVSPTRSRIASRPHDPSPPSPSPQELTSSSTGPGHGSATQQDSGCTSSLPIRLLLPSPHRPCTWDPLLLNAWPQCEHPDSSDNTPRPQISWQGWVQAEIPNAQQGEGKRAGEAKRPKTGLGPRTLVLWPTSSPTGLPTLALTSSLSSQLRPAHLWLPSKETRTAQDPPNRDSGLRGWVTPAVSSVTCLGEVEMTQVGTTPSLEEAWYVLGPNRAGLEHKHPCQPVLSQKVKSCTWGGENRALTRVN